MGADWDAQDSHQGVGQKPKLSLAGRLDGYVDGRPVSLVAEDRDITLITGKFRTLLTLRRSWQAIMQPLQAVLERAEIRLLVRMGWFGQVELFPNPNYLVRLLLPRV